ncbi:DUF1752-domain-containing protein [Sporormia fimetaria CBS 119925]|uniref:DUF1752-domain-containing protein n=1 Tax=Sporormia fimetaria CBS 119925 TaxID=1340428 RepID=A0A6A6UU94_9PLEO|nr:DUF1752-domain-containing protein [Sporormia fimetaria CBS 119925]
MPLHSERPVVRVEPSSMRTVETRDPENLFGLWSVFSRLTPAIEDGKRYENLAWRLWSRETFCCAHDHTFPPRFSFSHVHDSSDPEPPALSSSVASDDSVADTPVTAASTTARPHLQRHDSTSQARGKHTTPIDLEKVVSSIQSKKAIEPLSPLPLQLRKTPVRRLPSANTTPRPASPPPARYVPESSASTIATHLGSNATTPPVGSDASTSTELSTHSIVHGFAPGRISSSIRSSASLNPAPILKNSMSRNEVPRPNLAASKKKPVFTLGGSSDEDTVSSFEASYMAKRSSLSDSLHRPGPMPKVTSFKDQVDRRVFQDVSEESEEAVETESDTDSDDNAIESDDSDDDDEWEDDDNSGPASVNERELFQRVDSKPNLTSRRSLLTTMMHEGDRAKALQNAASRSTPAIRRSRTSSLNGPSTGSSPHEDSGLMMRPQVPRSRPIIMTTSNMHPPALSPRTTRRNMLQTELTQSLRANLLWERQQKNSALNAVNKRAQSAVSIPALRRAATTSDIRGLKPGAQRAAQPDAPFLDPARNNSSLNEYFSEGLQDYHVKGW